MLKTAIHELPLALPPAIILNPKKKAKQSAAPPFCWMDARKRDAVGFVCGWAMPWHNPRMNERLLHSFGNE